MSDEIKLPEPAFRLRWDETSASYKVSKPNIDDTDVYTAEQVRALLADSKAGGEPVVWEYRLRIRSWSEEWSQWYRTTEQANKERDQSRDSQWEYETRTLYTHPQQQAKPLTQCSANRDGDCVHAQCPQLRDGEPKKSGRHCPLDGEEMGQA